MASLIKRFQEGKIAEISIFIFIILLVLFAVLSGESPALAEVADATATWQDAPTADFPAGQAEDSPTESIGHASWYVHPRYRTEMMAASTMFPKGSKVKVTNLANNKSIMVTIKDWGPDPIKHPDRVIDLNKVAFAKIASTRAGIIDVRVELVLAPTSTVTIKTQ